MGPPWRCLLVLHCTAQLAAALRRQVLQRGRGAGEARPLLDERRGAHEERWQEGQGSFHMSVRGKAGTVQVPWLQTAWITSQQERQEFRQASLRQTALWQAQKPSNSTPSGLRRRLGLRSDGGMFPGIANFRDALALDVDPELADALTTCRLSTMGGYRHDQQAWNAWVRPAGAPGRVWIFVNGETSMGWEFWKEMQEILPPGDKGVILGNWWNESLQSYESPEVVSIWVPFASTSFAERRYHSPIDLWNRSRRTRFDSERKYTVAYQQTGCNWEREDYWDRINMAMLSRLNGTRGNSLGKCNGFHNLGERVLLPDFFDGPYPWGVHMDASVGRYEKFRFSFTAEHGENRHGYITEKIVNGFLAGTVPIYFGAAPWQVQNLFLPGTYIHASTRYPAIAYQSLEEFLKLAANSSEYESMLHRSEPLVSDEAMKRFFSWHPDLWPIFGDGLRTLILQKALKLCQSGANKTLTF